MSSQNPWDVLVGVEPQQQPYQKVMQDYPELAPQQDQTPWNSLNEAPESRFEGVTRVAAQWTQRALEGIYGTPGNLEKLGRSFLNIAEIKKPYMGENYKRNEKLVSEETFFPTTQEIREKVKRETGGKYEPKNEIERIGGNIIGDWVFRPGGPMAKTLTSIGAETAKEITGALGGGDTAKTLIDMATTFASSRFNHPTIRNYWNNQYNLATGSIPRNAKIAATKIQPTLDQVRQRVLAGGYADWKAPVIQQIETLEKNIQNGAVHVRDIDKAIHDINKQIYSGKLPGEAVRELQTLAKGGRRLLRQYGQTNPQFLEHWRNANAAYAGWASNRAASNFMEKYTNKLTAGSGSYALMTFLLKGTEATGKTVAAIASTYGIAKASEFTARIFANPVTRKYYMNAMLGALRENAPQMLNNFSKLDKELRKENQSR